MKLSGFRVELGDVEQGLASLPSVKEVVVLPAQKDGKVSHLVAHVQLSDPQLSRHSSWGSRSRRNCVRCFPIT